MTNDKVNETIKQIELTKKAFKMLYDLNKVAHNCLGLTEELIKKLSYDECIEVLAKCENIPISTKHALVDRLKNNTIKSNMKMLCHLNKEDNNNDKINN